MKVVMLCSSHGNQKALAGKIHKAVNLSAIIICAGVQPKKTLRALLQRVWRAAALLLTGLVFRRVWFNMLSHYEQSYPRFPIEPILSCNNINDPRVIAKIAELKPDLVVVSGTNLLRDLLISEILKTGKLMNLHTGISPYVKGGPNCTNWCLYLREFGLIGSTVMWLDAGIDSGNIVATERVPLTGSEDLLALHIKVMDHAHGLYVRAIEKFVKRSALPNVAQDSFDRKRLFMSKDWGLFQQLVALKNFYLFFKPGSKYLSLPEKTKLVDL
jgi:folate-dependent phosphoribosylglycinamide formyltransferase PurN